MRRTLTSVRQTHVTTAPRARRVWLSTRARALRAIQVCYYSFTIEQEDKKASLYAAVWQYRPPLSLLFLFVQ